VGFRAGVISIFCSCFNSIPEDLADPKHVSILGSGVCTVRSMCALVCNLQISAVAFVGPVLDFLAKRNEGCHDLGHVGSRRAWYGGIP
jgi:hypothetical protein